MLLRSEYDMSQKAPANGCPPASGDALEGVGNWLV